MNFFTNLSTRTKLIFSFGLICILFLVVIIIAYRGLYDISQSEKKLYDINFTIDRGMQQFRIHQDFNRATVLNMMLTNNKADQTVMEEKVNEGSKTIDDIVSSISKLNNDQWFQSQIQKLKDEAYLYRQVRKEEIELIKKGRIEEAKRLGTGQQEERYEKIRSLAAETSDRTGKDASNQLLSDQKKANSAIFLFVMLGIVVLIFSMVMIVLLNRTIAQPLNEVTRIAMQINEGDMNIVLPETKRRDEVGTLVQSFSSMVDTLKKMAVTAQQIASGDLTVSVTPQSEKDVLGNAFLQMLDNLRRISKDMLEGVNLLSSSTSEILAATTQVASSSAETASAITETTTTIEEVRQTAKQTSQKAGRVSDSAQQVVLVTQLGQNAVDDAINGMHEIRGQMEAVANTIVRLSEQSQQIGGIIATVNDVADQSNLLAVNAAIEAAKAGEQGKGFAVVAQEIKSLAQQSKQATVQVRSILSDIQRATSAAVMATEQTSKAVESGVKQSLLTKESIQKVAENSSKAMEAALQIVASSQQQEVGVDQVGLAMQNINQAGMENAASMVQTEKVAMNLNELGQRLKTMAEQYKVE